MLRCAREPDHHLTERPTHVQPRQFCSTDRGRVRSAVIISSFAAGPRDHTVVTTEFSVENKPDDKNKKVVPKGAVQKQAPVHVAPRVIERHNGPPAGAQKNIGQQKNFEVKKKIEVQKKIEVHKDIGVQKNIGTQKTIKLQKTVGKPKVFTPHGKNAGIVITSKIRGAPTRGAFRTSIRGRNYSPWRSGYRARYHGGWRTFVALSTLGAITIGAAEYYLYRRPGGLLRRTDRGRLPDDL